MATGWKAAALATILAATAHAQDSAMREGMKPAVKLQPRSIMRIAANSWPEVAAPSYTMLGSFGSLESRFTMTNLGSEPAYVRIQTRDGQSVQGYLGPGQLFWAEDLAYDLGMWGQGFAPVDFFVDAQEPEKLIFNSKLIDYGFNPAGTAGMTTEFLKYSEAIGPSQLFGFQVPASSNGRLFLQSFPSIDSKVQTSAFKDGREWQLYDITVPSGEIIDATIAAQGSGAYGKGLNLSGGIEGFSAIENGIGDMYGSRLATRYEQEVIIPGVKNHVPAPRGNHQYDVDLTTSIGLARIIGPTTSVTLTSYLEDGKTRSIRTAISEGAVMADNSILEKLGIERGKTAAVRVACDDAPCIITNAHTEVRPVPTGKRRRAVGPSGPAFTRAEENPILIADKYIDPAHKSVIANAGNWRGARTTIGIFAQERLKADIEVYFEDGAYLGSAPIDIPAGTYKELDIGNTICLPEFAYGRIEVKPASGKGYVASWRVDQGSRDSWTSKGAILPNDGPTKLPPETGWPCAF
jgi:hypothetical protein